MCKIILFAAACMLPTVASAQLSYGPPPGLDPGLFMPRSEATASIATLSAGNRIILDNITISETATIALTAGVRTVRVVSNCLPGDRMFMEPAAPLPTGVALHNIRCIDAGGAADVTLTAPFLAIGSGYTATAMVTAFRP